jgi:hypothetical protein
MTDAASQTSSGGPFRLTATRASRGADAVERYDADITARVVAVGPIEERYENPPGVGVVASVAVECVPDAALAPEGPLFKNRGANADVELVIAARRKDGGYETIFAGVMAADPAYERAADTARVILRFIGRLAALWGDDALTLERNGAPLRWGHVADDLIPALLAASAAPPATTSVALPDLTAAEPFWSYYGPPSDDAAAPARGLAWDSKRRRLYVGVGATVRAFDAATRAWEDVASVRYGGSAPEPAGVTWRAAHLEYDAGADRLLGVAESAETDVTRRDCHLKATFVLDFGSGGG